MNHHVRKIFLAICHNSNAGLLALVKIVKTARGPMRHGPSRMTSFSNVRPQAARATLYSGLCLCLCLFFAAYLSTVGDAKAEEAIKHPAAKSMAQCVDLRCEYRDNPLGIDEPHPRLSWKLTSQSRSQRQTAYRILVASTEEGLANETGDLWDSGKIESNATLHIAYDGKPLASGQACFWKVRAWDREGIAGDWSRTASWSMGLLHESDWKARFISFRDTTPVFKDRTQLYLPPARQYRKLFHADKKIKRAVIYASALGIFDLELNGQPVSHDYFAPGWTDYHQRAYYRTYDVTEQMQHGENVLGATVADGWYSGYVGFGLLVGIGTEQIGRYTYGKTPALLAQLEIEYEDGSQEQVVTDTTWKVTDAGAVREADLLMGESYDARREMPGWSSPGFDETDSDNNADAWQPAILAAENGPQPATFYQFENPEKGGPKIVGKAIDLAFHPPRLEAFPGVPVKVTQELKPVKVTQRGEGTYVFDMGQNFAGNVRLRIKGPAGHKVTLRYAEMLHPDGRMMTENLRKARATDTYTCKGSDDTETWSPRYTFHGFQFVEVSNFPGEANLETITGLVIHSDTPLVSTFTCSDPMVNQLYQNVVWTQRANFLDLPTDCPQRDERMGWTGDAQAYVATAAYNADIGAFYTKWLRELMESQRPSGAFPGYAPYPFQHGWDFGTAWADAGVICPWTIWQVYGDTRVIDRCWQPMTRFMQWRKETSVDDLGVTHGNAWGDWLAQGEDTPLDYIDSVYFAISTRMMAEMAEATRRDDQAKQYREQLARTKAAFQKKYLASDGSVNIPTQSAQALALFADLVPNELRAGTARKLAAMIETNGNHMATGFLGTRPLLPVLSSAGQHELATFLLQSHEFPSWGYEIDQGATSIWERWDSYTRQDGFGRHNAAMNSFSHYAFGAVNEWMFRVLAGMDAAEPGYAKIAIRPTPPAPGSNAMHRPIDWVKASYDSIRGLIRSEWKLADGLFELHVSIPANTTAVVYLPTDDSDSIRESGQPLDGNADARLLRMENDRAVLAIGSGDYQFTAKSNLAPADVALRTSKPKDNSLNPQQVDLTNAKRVVHYDFHNSADVAKWKPSRLEIAQRDGKTYLIAAGDDSQMETVLKTAFTGPLVVALRAMPAKGATSQFFWTEHGTGFNGQRQSKRKLQSTEQLNDYLFKLEANPPVGKLRFDPFATYDEHANKGEMEIESISIYTLPKDE